MSFEVDLHYIAITHCNVQIKGRGHCPIDNNFLYVIGRGFAKVNHGIHNERKQFGVLLMKHHACTGQQEPHIHKIQRHTLMVIRFNFVYIIQRMN